VPERPPSATDAVSRRRFLATAVVGLSGGMSGCALFGDDGSDQPLIDESLPESVRLDPIATGLRAPVDVVAAPDTDRRYVADQEGQVRVHEADGLRDAPLLDLRDAIEFGGEKGLLGIALHPEFEIVGGHVYRGAALP
jgi:glucose/arabinose dehydrogenase